MPSLKSCELVSTYKKWERQRNIQNLCWFVYALPNGQNVGQAWTIYLLIPSTSDWIYRRHSNLNWRSCWEDMASHICIGLDKTVTRHIVLDVWKKMPNICFSYVSDLLRRIHTMLSSLGNWEYMCQFPKCVLPNLRRETGRIHLGTYTSKHLWVLTITYW